MTQPTTDQTVSLADAFARDPEATNEALNVGMNTYLRLNFTELTRDSVRAQWDVRPDMHQPFGLVHGGIYCSVIETLASIAGAAWLDGKGNCVGVNNSTDFLRAAREGTLYGHAAPIHRGRLQQLWAVAITDERDRLIARGQVRLQNIVETDRIGN